MLGICCFCKEAHEVCLFPGTEEFTDFDDDFYDFAGVEFFVQDYHIPSFGVDKCEGTGTMPQSLIREWQLA